MLGFAQLAERLTDLSDWAGVSPHAVAESQDSDERYERAVSQEPVVEPEHVVKKLATWSGVSGVEAVE
jgi:hypothetical protein